MNYWRFGVEPVSPREPEITLWNRSPSITRNGKGLLKSRSRVSAVPPQQAFVERAKELFDIAHQDALSLIKIAEDKLFLQAQRGRMAVDLALARKDEQRMIRAVAEAERQA